MAVAGEDFSPSARESELLELAYQYALVHGLTDLSLRPLATAIGSSPRVLLYLYGSKDGLIRALLARARADELDLLGRLPSRNGERSTGLDVVAEQIWSWLVDTHHRGLLTLWVEAYARSLVEPGGSWAGFARATVEDWLSLLAMAQPAAERNTAAGRAGRSLVLAVLRGAMLDVLATGDVVRTTEAVHQQLATLRAANNRTSGQADPADVHATE